MRIPFLSNWFNKVAELEAKNKRLEDMLSKRIVILVEDRRNQRVVMDCDLHFVALKLNLNYKSTYCVKIIGEYMKVYLDPSLMPEDNK